MSAHHHTNILPLGPQRVRLPRQILLHAANVLGQRIGFLLQPHGLHLGDDAVLLLRQLVLVGLAAPAHGELAGRALLLVDEAELRGHAAARGHLGVELDALRQLGPAAGAVLLLDAGEAGLGSQEGGVALFHGVAVVQEEDAHVLLLVGLGDGVQQAGGEAQEVQVRG